MVGAVAQRRLGPSSSATTSTVDRALPSSAVQVRCWTRPTTTTRLPFDRDSEWAACSGLVAPHHHGEERRLPLPPPRHRHPEPGPGDPALGVADLGVVGQGAGEADAGFGHGVPLPVAWPGGLPCPWTRGTVDTVACRETIRGRRQSQRSRPYIKVAGRGRFGCRLGGRRACGWGSGMPAPSGQLPPPWAWWEIEAPTTRAARRPVPGQLR
jgi:hypothetical protein